MKSPYESIHALVGTFCLRCLVRLNHTSKVARCRGLRQIIRTSLFFLYLCDTHGDEMTHDEQLQVDALYQNALRLIEQRNALQQEIETQRREIADLKARLSEQCNELEGLESRNRQLLMARALIVSGTDMGIAKERLSQMIKRMDQSIALLELQHSTATTQPH